MPRYWVIAPFSSIEADMFERVWEFDLANGCISIGWSRLGDVSALDRQTLATAVSTAFPDKPQGTRTLIANMLWAFFHEIQPGDIILARRGRRVLAAVGEVVRSGYYALGKNPALAAPPRVHGNFLDIRWRATPRDQRYPSIVFPMHTLMEITDEQCTGLLGGNLAASPVAEPPAAPPDSTSFVLERYLEDFIVRNFASIFRGELQLYTDDDGADGQQFSTDVGIIDILALETSTNSLVVIELKKGRPSDQVVGQVLRYMGWVKENLCKPTQQVRGLVICSDADPRLTYALKMVSNVQAKYYSVSFALRDAA